MSAIPDTRKVDPYQRVNIPVEIASSYSDGATFDAAVSDGDIVLTPSGDGSGSKMTEKNRIRLPTTVLESYHEETEFAVLKGDDEIVLRPVENIDISV